MYTIFKKMLVVVLALALLLGMAPEAVQAETPPIFVSPAVFGQRPNMDNPVTNTGEQCPSAPRIGKVVGATLVACTRWEFENEFYIEFFITKDLAERWGEANSLWQDNALLNVTTSDGKIYNDLGSLTLRPGAYAITGKTWRENDPSGSFAVGPGVGEVDYHPSLARVDDLAFKVWTMPGVEERELLVNETPVDLSQVTEMLFTVPVYAGLQWNSIEFTWGEDHIEGYFYNPDPPAIYLPLIRN